MTRVALLVMYALMEAEATSLITAATINEIWESSNCFSFARSTIANACETLVNAGYVSYGAKASNAYTYYITKDGQKFYKQNL